MALRTARPFASRVRHVIAFIAIVWGIAATFVAFEVVSLSAVDLALSHPDLFGDLMLSRTVTESTSCAAPAGSERPQPSTMISEADARVGPWLLGISLGRDAVFRQYAGSNRQVLEQLAQGPRRPCGAALRFLARTLHAQADRQREHRVRGICRARRRR